MHILLYFDFIRTHLWYIDNHDCLRSTLTTALSDCEHCRCFLLLPSWAFKMETTGKFLLLQPIDVVASDVSAQKKAIHIINIPLRAAINLRNLHRA